jgi:hypothetical protein
LETSGFRSCFLELSRGQLKISFRLFRAAFVY